MCQNPIQTTKNWWCKNKIKIIHNRIRRNVWRNKNFEIILTFSAKEFCKNFLKSRHGLGAKDTSLACEILYSLPFLFKNCFPFWIGFVSNKLKWGEVDVVRGHLMWESLFLFLFHIFNPSLYLLFVAEHSQWYFLFAEDIITYCTF